jgi:hypothetical protein
VAVHDVTRGAVHHHLLHPAHLIERAAQRLALVDRMRAPVLGIGEELVGRLLAAADDAVLPG